MTASSAVGVWLVLTAAVQFSSATYAQTRSARPSQGLPSLYQIRPVDEAFTGPESSLDVPVADKPAWLSRDGWQSADSTSAGTARLDGKASPAGTVRPAAYQVVQQSDAFEIRPTAYGVTIPASSPQPANVSVPPLARVPGDPPLARVPGDQSAVDAPGVDVPAVRQPAEAVAPGDAVAVPVVQANSGDGDPAAALLSIEVIQHQRTAIEQAPDLTEEIRSQALKLNQQAADAVKLMTESIRRTAELKAERDNAANMIAEAKALLAQPLPPAEAIIAEGSSLAELEQFRLADEVRADEARKALEAWEARAKVRAERKPQLPTIIEKTRQQLADARKALDVPATEGEPPVLTQARRTDRIALVQLLQQQIDQYRLEQMRYDALTEWFPLQRDQLTRSRYAYEKRLELWKAAVAEARRLESERQAREARETLRNAHPALHDLAERNSELTVRRKAVQDLLATSQTSLTAVNKTLEGLDNDFENVKEKEARAGLTTGIGLLLRNQRNHLPAADQYRQMLLNTEGEIVRLQLEQMQLEDEARDLGDLDERTQQTLDEVRKSGVAVTDEIQGMVFEMMRDRRKYLDALLADHGTCLLRLSELDVSCRRLADRIMEYENYIDERVLWIRSAAAVDTDTVQRTIKAAQIIMNPRSWTDVGGHLLRDLQARVWVYALALIAGLGLLVFSRRLRVLIRGLSRRQHWRSSVGIPATLLALGLTVVLASAWPALTWLVGWRLSAESSDDFTLAVAVAVRVTAIVFWSVEVFRQICRNQGIAETFLDWPVSIIRSLNGSLRSLLAFGLPLVFLVALSERVGEGIWADSLGRAAFVAFCALLAVLLRRTIRPDGPGLGEILRSAPNGWMTRTKSVWYPVVVGAPLALALLALSGYVYTAQQLMLRLQLTLTLCVMLTIAYTLVTQWMLEARRRLAMEQARSRRAAALAAAQQGEDASGSPVPPIEAPRIDLSVLNRQLLHLVQGTACVLFLTFGWMIWSRVLPALQVFNRVELWSTTVTVAKSIDLGNGLTEIREVTELQPIVLGGLIIALGILGIAVLASRNLPGLLELVILQRLPLDHGGRHAVTTLCRYALMMTGILMAFKTIGVGWSSVQWLVAALTVGLGFGLQEIFANFVSGLIILFERPIRIGDVVTIDGVSGSVSRIQIRATTITDWDRKEYIVPNKEFVTGRLLNWTLSDKTNRVMINVGVAYGSDTARALKLMLKVAEEHPLVLEDPAPITTFEGFGDSCLNMVLRCYLPNLDHRLQVITDLHSAIDQEFRRACIEIAFPQRDLHLRTVAPNVAAIPLEAPDAHTSAEETPQDAVHSETRAA